MNQGNAALNGESNADPGLAGHSNGEATEQRAEVAVSGVVPAPHEAGLQARVRAANLDFLQRVNDALSLPMQVLVEQRDAAYRDLAEQDVRAHAELERVQAEHERFVSFLMEEQLANLRHVRDQLDAAKLELQRARALAGAAPSTEGAVGGAAATPGEGDDAAPSLEAFYAMRRELEAAFQEVDETRSQAARLQEERDEAIRATDDVRLELQEKLDGARDETFEVQTKLDAVLRQLDDARDEARDEAMRLTEELDDLRRQLDERTEEVRRLRARLEDSVDEVKHSRPPPPGASSELDTARREIKWLRQQLIETKRKMSKNPTEPQRPKSPWKPAPRADAALGGDGTAEGTLQSPKVPELGG